MKIIDLKKAMDARFEQVDARVGQVDARFEQVDARFDQVDARFARRFDRLEARMATEHETTLRQMDILFEQLKAEYRLGLSGLSLPTSR
jgi:hypothetical protein